MRTATLYNFLLEANLMASIAILLMMPLRKTLRKPLGNAAINVGWLLIAIRLLLPLTLPNPYIHAIRTPYAPDEAIRPIAGQIKVRLTDLFDGLSLGGEGLARQTAEGLRSGMNNASLPITLSKIYLIGLLIVSAWFVFANVRFRLRIRAGHIEAISGKLLADYQALCAEMKLEPLPVYFTDPLPSACLVGVIRPSIALPLTVSPQNALQVLRHELSHYQNKDHLWGVLRLLCCAVHWFNPLVWLAAFMSQTDSELRCDDKVTAQLSPKEKEAYARVLVLSAARRQAPGLSVLATGMTHTHRKLKTRVRTVLDSQKPLRWLSLAFILLAGMSLVAAFATTEAPLKPRLSLTADYPAAQEIASPEEALAYAQALLALEALGTAPDQTLKWQADTLQDDPNAFLVTATPEGEDRALLPFCLTGPAGSIAMRTLKAAGSRLIPSQTPC